ncbi:Crp/Fnr family transcriptional regulator [Allokutzneria albata]|uniref:cAMP-binding domain of CRP or a regulatory subunit of cAMP-dependent protein kinases n=1 Tax=Allokutzneria albata TaxID=211114 RepID=A0A1H0DS57_ALLAB|nr:Crp/Fnr family transcriptional regulator [Allokutzneria albata]SDN72876.1 cAMP-binding domain of CRP or a regulatory subunit of cAMP-dependent protein kinases [Allokutzneria albata]
MGEGLYEPGSPLLTSEDLLRLEEVGTVLRRQEGHVFIQEGEDTSFALLIRKGHVKVVVGEPGRIVAVRGPGDVVGEMAAFRRKPRSASVVALGEVEVLHLPASAWLEFMYANPRAMHAQIFAADERLEQATKKVAESELAVEQRLAKALVELMGTGLGKQVSAGVEFRLGQADLASLTGASLDSVKKVIRAFKENGILTTGRQSLAVRDREALEAISCGNRIATI